MAQKPNFTDGIEIDLVDGILYLMKNGITIAIPANYEGKILRVINAMKFLNNYTKEIEND